MPSTTKVPPRPAPPKVSPPRAKAAPWKTVMVVDSDGDNRKRVVELLREAARGARDQTAGPAQTAGPPPPAESRALAIHEAENGNAAWALVEVVKPDLVVSEILLEGLSGMQLLRRLRERYDTEAPAMIFVTTMSNEVDRYWALRNGATAYIVKPFEDDFLRSRAIRFFEDGDEGGLDLDSSWVADP